MPRDEKIYTMEIVFSPHIAVGQALEVEREPVIVVGVAHRMDGCATSTLRVVEPNWLWKLRYKARRLLRRAWRIITAPFRRLQERARRG